MPALAINLLQIIDKEVVRLTEPVMKRLDKEPWPQITSPAGGSGRACLNRSLDLGVNPEHWKAGNTPPSSKGKETKQEIFGPVINSSSDETFGK